MISKQSRWRVICLSSFGVNMNVRVHYVCLQDITGQLAHSSRVFEYQAFTIRTK